MPGLPAHTSRLRTRGWVAPAVLLACSVVVSGCAQSTPQESGTAAPGPSGQPSGEQTTITLYTSEPQAKIDEVIAAFNDTYPDISVDVFRAGTGDLTARIESEQKAGEIQADILLAADAPTFEAYAAEGLLSEMTIADVDALDPAVVDEEGFYVGTRIIPTVIAYNTGVVQEAPPSWQSLTGAEYAEKIAMPNPDVSGAAAFNAAVWLNEDALGEPWLTSLAANKPVILDSNGPVSEAVASGTQPVGVVVDYLVRDLAAAGSPIAVAYPEEGVPFVSQPAGIFQASDQQEAAQTFIDFLVSDKGQEIAVQQSYLPVRGDVGTPEGAPAMSEITLLDPDLDTITTLRPEAVKLFDDLFQ